MLFCSNLPKQSNTQHYTKAENYLKVIEKLRIFSIQSKRNQYNIRKNHVVLGMAELAVIRRDLQ